MPPTVKADLVIPEVISAEVVTNALFAETPLLRSPFVLDLSTSKGVIYKEGGDDVTFLTKEFGDGVTKATDYVKPLVRDSHTAQRGEKIKIAKYTEAVLDRNIPIEYDELALEDLATQADVNGFFGEIIAEAFAETLQAELFSAANANGKGKVSMVGESTKTLTVDAILRAKMMFGEKFTRMGYMGMYVHSKAYTDLGLTSDYKALASSANNAIVEAQAANGAVAMIHGVLLYVADSVPNSAGLTVDTITRASAVATIAFNEEHMLAVGDVLSVSGATQTEYNGDHVVATVVDENTVTYAVTGTPATPATGTPVVTANYNNMILGPKALGLLIKDTRTKPAQRSTGTSVSQVDTFLRWVKTRFKHKPIRCGALITR